MKLVLCIVFQLLSPYACVSIAPYWCAWSWFRDLLRSPLPAQMLLAFSIPVLISLGISGKGSVNSSGTGEGSSELVCWNPGKMLSANILLGYWDLSLGKGMVLYLGKTLTGEKESPGSPRAFLVQLPGIWNVAQKRHEAGCRGRNDTFH